MLPEIGKDIEGFGAAGGSTLPDILTSTKGVDNRQAVAGLRNAILKARSGGAVTDGEADRMLQELGTGLGRNDENLRVGIANVTQMLQEKLLNVGAGYSPSVRKLYEDNGGTVTPARLEKFLKSPKQKPEELEFNARKVATPEEIAAFKKKHGVE
jgi:hypothetical protein